MRLSELHQPNIFVANRHRRAYIYPYPIRCALTIQCYDLNEFNSGCNERQRLEGEKGIINELVKHKEYRSITMLLIQQGLPRVTINGVGLSNYD
jgi:hypothetical protein